MKFFDISSTQAPPPPRPRGGGPEEDQNEDGEEAEDDSDSALEEELERERQEEEYVMDRSTWKPTEKQFYHGKLVFQISSDSRSIVIKPLPAAEKHDVKVFGMENFVPGVSGSSVAFDTIDIAEDASARKRRKKKKHHDNSEIGGGVRVRPSVLGGGKTAPLWTIVAWILLPIKNTGRLHALVGGKNGEAHVVVGDDAETLGND